MFGYPLLEVFGACLPHFLAGSLGQTFSRELKQNSKDEQEYRSLVGHQAKKAWRNKWLEAKLEQATKKQVKATKQSVASELSGQYLPFRKVWEAEGLDSDGYKVPWGR